MQSSRKATLGVIIGLRAARDNLHFLCILPANVSPQAHTRVAFRINSCLLFYLFYFFSSDTVVLVLCCVASLCLYLVFVPSSPLLVQSLSASLVSFGSSVKWEINLS